MLPLKVLDLTELATGKQVWIVGDIHGYYGLFQRLLELIGYSPDTHLIVTVGDMVDRGEDSPAVVRWFQENGYAVRGNHEDMWLEIRFWAEGLPYDDGGRLNPAWLQWTRKQSFVKNGMARTLRQFLESGMSANEWLDYFAELPYAIIIGDYLIVHAGVDPHRPFSEQTFQHLTWIRHGFVDYRGLIPPEARLGKRVVCGHCETFWFAEPGKPVIRPDRVHIDIGTANGLALAAFCLNTEEVVMVDAPGKNEVLGRLRPLSAI